MTLIQALVLGTVQGLTEFLPISSSAHLILVPWLLGWKDQGLTFDVMLHAGTLVALLSFFWQDWVGMIAATFRSGNPAGKRHEGGAWFLFMLICATIPAAVAGFLAQKTIETQLRSPLVLATTLIGLALLLWLAERLASLKKSLNQVSILDALSIGLAQALALIPGTSRSGITITTGLFRGLTREAAARFSFLLSAPIIAGAALKKLLDLRHTGIETTERLPLFFGFVASMVVGYYTIKYLLRFLQTNTLYIFVCYRIILGVVILLLIQFAGFRP
jgi:undecaprenyl-diphosphatase